MNAAVLTNISHIHFTETFLHMTSPIIPEFRLNFNNLPAGSACHVAENVKGIAGPKSAKCPPETFWEIVG